MTGLVDVLRLRRQAADHGWRLASTTATRHGRTFRYERDDVLDGGWAQVKPAHWGGGAGEYVPLRVSINTPNGFLVVEHVAEPQAVRLVRALFDWPDVEAPAGTCGGVS
jgi:hypothetical protein